MTTIPRKSVDVVGRHQRANERQVVAAGDAEEGVWPGSHVCPGEAGAGALGHSFLIHLSINGHSDFFHILATVTNAAMNN